MSKQLQVQSTFRSDIAAAFNALGALGQTCPPGYPNHSPNGSSTICQAPKEKPEWSTNGCYRCVAGGCPGDYFSKAYWHDFGGDHYCDVALAVNPSDSGCYRCPSGNIASWPWPAGGGGGGGGGNVPGSGSCPSGFVMTRDGTCISAPGAPFSPTGPGGRGTPPGGGQTSAGRGSPPPICQPPFTWQQQCTADRPKVILSEDGCNTCLRDGGTPCAPGWYRPPMGWVFGGCPRGYAFAVNDETGCVTCTIQGCPAPYVRGPQTCQAGWQSVHHPRYPECVACAPIPPGQQPAAPDQTGAAPGPDTATTVPPQAGMSTGAKVGIGLAVAALAYAIFGGKK